MVAMQNPARGVSGAEIHVELRSPGASAYAAIVKLCGEHDLATGKALRDALAPIHGSVLVDLSDCAFIDSTALCAFILDARTRSREGHRLELAVPERNTTVVRTLQVSGLTEMLTVHALPDPD